MDLSSFVIKIDAKYNASYRPRRPCDSLWNSPSVGGPRNNPPRMLRGNHLNRAGGAADYVAFLPDQSRVGKNRGQYVRDTRNRGELILDMERDQAPNDGDQEHYGCNPNPPAGSVVAKRDTQLVQICHRLDCAPVVLCSEAWRFSIPQALL